MQMSLPQCISPVSASTSMTRQASSSDAGRGSALLRQPRNVLLAIGALGVQSCRYHIHCLVIVLYIPDVQNVSPPVRTLRLYCLSKLFSASKIFHWQSGASNSPLKDQDADSPVLSSMHRAYDLHSFC